MGMQHNENTAFRREYFEEVITIAIILPFLLYLLFAFLIALWKVSDMWQLSLALVVFFGGLSIHSMLRLLRFRKPVLVLTHEGLEYPKMFGDERIQVRWSEIKSIELIRHYTGKMYVYELGLKLKTPLVRKNVKIKRTIPLLLSKMKGDARVIHQDILDCWQRYRDVS